MTFLIQLPTMVKRCSTTFTSQSSLCGLPPNLPSPLLGSVLHTLAPLPESALQWTARVGRVTAPASALPQPSALPHLATLRGKAVPRLLLSPLLEKERGRGRGLPG